MHLFDIKQLLLIAIFHNITVFNIYFLNTFIPEKANLNFHMIHS